MVTTNNNKNVHGTKLTTLNWTYDSKDPEFRFQQATKQGVVFQIYLMSVTQLFRNKDNQYDFFR